MKFQWMAVAVGVSVIGWAQPTQGAEIQGRVTFKGEEPDPIEIPFGPQCKQLHADKDAEEKPVMDFYRVGPKNGLGDVLVHIKEGLPEKDYEAPEEPAKIDQDGCVYKPYVLSMQVGQTLEVHTSDPVLHNVHAPNLGFNQVQLAGQKPFEFSFDEPKRFLHFKCDVHPWMHSYVNIMPHPYHTVTQAEEEGQFTFEDLEPGEYVIEAHHRKLGKVTQKVSLADADASETVELTLELKEEE